jgi:predicted glutamine amidotransferase
MAIGYLQSHHCGTDSCGVAYYDQNCNIRVAKTVGAVAKLAPKLNGGIHTPIAIMHTRMATTGAVAYRNAHPFLSENRDIALAGNGVTRIIKKFDTFHFLKGETDTETLLHFIEDAVDFSGSYEEIADQLHEADEKHSFSHNLVILAKGFLIVTKFGHYRLSIGKGTNSIAVSTVSFENKRWKSVARGDVLFIKDGDVIYTKNFPDKYYNWQRSYGGWGGAYGGYNRDGVDYCGYTPYVKEPTPATVSAEAVVADLCGALISPPKNDSIPATGRQKDRDVSTIESYVARQRQLNRRANRHIQRQPKQKKTAPDGKIIGWAKVEGTGPDIVCSHCQPKRKISVRDYEDIRQSSGDLPYTYQCTMCKKQLHGILRRFLKPLANKQAGKEGYFNCGEYQPCDGCYYFNDCHKEPYDPVYDRENACNTCAHKEYCEYDSAVLCSMYKDNMNPIKKWYNCKDHLPCPSCDYYDGCAEAYYKQDGTLCQHCVWGNSCEVDLSKDFDCDHYSAGEPRPAPNDVSEACNECDARNENGECSKGYACEFNRKETPCIYLVDDKCTTRSECEISYCKAFNTNRGNFSQACSRTKCEANNGGLCEVNANCKFTEQYPGERVCGYFRCYRNIKGQCMHDQLPCAHPEERDKHTGSEDPKKRQVKKSGLCFICAISDTCSFFKDAGQTRRTCPVFKRIKQPSKVTKETKPPEDKYLSAYTEEGFLKVIQCDLCWYSDDACDDATGKIMYCSYFIDKNELADLKEAEPSNLCHTCDLSNNCPEESDNVTECDAYGDEDYNYPPYEDEEESVGD